MTARPNDVADSSAARWEAIVIAFDVLVIGGSFFLLGLSLPIYLGGSR